jgi:N-acetyl-anhydromuramyl-L-alanine amidase AmpD
VQLLRTGWTAGDACAVTDPGGAAAKRYVGADAILAAAHHTAVVRRLDLHRHVVIYHRSSPNHGRRPIGVDISAIVLHADASTKTSGTLSWLARKESGVSYHFLVGRAGHVYQCVQPTRRAWHAGVSSFGGVRDCNDYSIGVCFSNDQRGERFADPALDAGAELVASLMERYPAITLDRVTTHAAVALPKGRKVDPGPHFPLTLFLSRVQHYYKAGIGRLPPAA